MSDKCHSVCKLSLKHTNDTEVLALVDVRLGRGQAGTEMEMVRGMKAERESGRE